MSDGSGYKYIRCKGSGKYLDIKGASKNQGTNLIQYRFNGNYNQQFKFVENSDGTYNIYVRISGLLLDVKGASSISGTPII